MRITIVTISFNQARFLKAAIDSIVRQGYPDLDYVVVDPGSSDSSRDVIKQYGDQISKSILEPDAGPADGLNKGFACATGEILGFVNADDELLPHSLQFVADYFVKHSDVDVLLGCGRIVDETGAILRRIVPSRFSLLHYAFGRFEFIQQAIFFRRSTFESIGGFNSSNIISWDGELLVDMAIAGARFARTDKELGVFRIYPSSISGSGNYLQKLSLEKTRLFQKIMERGSRWYDLALGQILLASKWILDPWYAYRKVTRNCCVNSFFSRRSTPVMDHIKALLRPIRFRTKLAFAQFKVLAWPPLRRRQIGKFAFIVGCGRSGTTILGKTLSLHSKIQYYFEPWHLWQVVDRRTDVLHLFGKDSAHIFMGAEFYNNEAQRRFARVFKESIPIKKQICIEKTPHNVMRIGYLDALEPSAKFIHIVRDGVQVANSIGNLIDNHPYRLAFRKNFNLWWGDAGNKWEVLMTEGAAAGYFPGEVSFLKLDREKGAYEWLVSIGEADRQRERLGDRLLEIRYDDLFMIHSGKWIFIRFNPDSNRDNTDIADKLEILVQTIQNAIDRIMAGTNTELVEIIKLFY